MTTNHRARGWRHIAVIPMAAAIAVGADVAAGTGVASADEGTPSNNVGSAPGSSTGTGIGLGGTASASRLAPNPQFEKAISLGMSWSTLPDAHTK